MSLLKVKVNFFQILLKEFFSGFVVFMIPVVAFFKPHNLRELATFETHIIVESLFIVMFLLIIASIFLHFTITKIFKINHDQYLFYVVLDFVSFLVCSFSQLFDSRNFSSRKSCIF